MSVHVKHRMLSHVCLGIFMLVIGIGAIGVPTITDSLQLIANAKFQWADLQSGLSEPITIKLELRYANGEPINASSPLARYTGNAGPVFGINGAEIFLATGTQLLWSGRAYDSQGYPAKSIDLGLFYFVTRDGCDETQGRSCYTTSALVAKTKTNSDGSFGFLGRLPPPLQELSAWNLPREAAGKVIIVYADFLTATTINRVKMHYAVKLTEPPAILGVWINGHQIIDFGRNIQYASIDSGPVTFNFELRAGQQAYLVVGKCGSQACHDTPPQESIITREITPDTANGSVTVSLDPSYYVFYILTLPVDPFRSVPSRGTVLAVGMFDTLPIVTPSEYQLLGLVPLSVGFVLLFSVPFDLTKQLFLKRGKLAKMLEVVKKAPLKSIMVVAVLSRGLVFVMGITTASIFGERLLCQYCGDIGIPFISLFSRWDSYYYAAIALHGYSNLIVPQWAFFPSYPALIGVLGRLLAMVTPMPQDLAVYSMGFVVSNLAFFGSVYYMYKLSVLVLQNAKLAAYSALFLVFYLAGVFLSAVYSDSLFLLLTLSSLYYWRMRGFKKSALLGFFGALTRPVGIFLVVPYLYESLTDASSRKEAILYLPVASVLLGFLSFLAFSQLMTGTPFATFEAEHLYWGVTLNLHSVLMSAYNDVLGNPIIFPYLALAIGGIVTSILSVKSKEESAIDAYGLVLLATYMFAPLISFPRYTITLVPAYWGYARWSQRAVAGRIVFAVFLILLVIGVGLFVNWYSFY